jgi:hypothetical protein
MVTAKQLAELAQEIESTDPIVWGRLEISEQAAYEMMASQVMSQFLTTNENKEVVMLATITKLLVENFVLHLRLQDK